MASLFDGLNSTVGAMQALPIVQAQSSEQRNLFDEAVILNLTFRVFGTSRKLKDDDYQVDADKRKTSASKGICQSAELKKIKSFDGETRALIEMRTLPSQFKSGLYLLKLTAIEQVDDLLSERLAIRANLIEQFLAVYPELKTRDALPADQGGLGGLFQDKDYPGVATVRESFSMDYSYSEFSAPGRLKGLNMVIYEREKAKAQDLWHSAIEEGQALLRAEFAGLVEHMRERLTVGPGEQPKKFKNSITANLGEFLSTFDARDIAQDEQLKGLVKQAADMLSGITPDDLRKSDTVRARVSADIERIKAALDPLVISGPVRKINLTVDESWGAL